MPSDTTWSQLVWRLSVRPLNNRALNVIFATRKRRRDMKMRLTSLALMMVLLLTPLSFAAAKTSSDRFSVPISGTFTDQAGGIGRFAGTFTITSFAVVNNSIHAVGGITGTL